LPGQFAVPAGVYVDKLNRAFVTDQMQGRLQVFRYVTDSEAKVLKDERDHQVAQSGPQGTAVAEQKK